MSSPLDDEFIPTRESLLGRLRSWEDQTSWKAFFDIYWKMIYGVARQAGLTDAEAQDVVQETVITVAKKMPDFRYDPALGSFKAWLMQITRRRIADLLRKKQYANAGQRLLREIPLGTTLLAIQPDAAGPDLERLWDQEWTKTLTETALERVKGKVPARQFQIFYLHVCKNIPAQTVARQLELNLAQVYFAKYKVSRLVQNEIKRLEKSVL